MEKLCIRFKIIARESSKSLNIIVVLLTTNPADIQNFFVNFSANYYNSVSEVNDKIDLFLFLFQFSISNGNPKFLFPLSFFFTSLKRVASM